MKLYCINILSLLLGFQGLPLSAVPHPRMHPMHLPHSRLTQAPCPPRPSPSWAVSSVPYTSTATGTSQVCASTALLMSIANDKGFLPLIHAALAHHSKGVWGTFLCKLPALRVAIINFFSDHAAIYFNIIKRSISIVQY